MRRAPASATPPAPGESSVIPSYARLVVVVVSVVAAATLGIRSAPRPASASDAAPRVFAPFGEPLPGFDAEARARFDRGRIVAMRRFTPSAGLGPEYNAVSCAGCHEKPVVGGGASRYRGVFVARHSTDTFTTPFEHHFTTESVSRTPRGRTTATRAPLPFFGIGLLAEIPAEEILRRVDPNDRNDDGVRGKVNFERGFIGRFGRKAQMSSLQGFVRLALRDQMGVTTSPVKPLYLAERDAPVELPTRDGDLVADPELGPDELTDLLAFVALLAPPPPDPKNAETRAGEALFASTGCSGCHTPALRGPRGTVFAYTDLLLHDMGPELADDVVVGEANERDFRTQPLWGLAAAGLYLHDGRADTIDEAIRLHGGEALAATRKYDALPRAQRDALIAFLRSLGGSERRNDGLLPKDTRLPAPGDIGGPFAELSPTDAARFARGRELFDHDFEQSEGLGPKFNGDACRSCHFDPTIGGAGPSDVDVVRQGLLENGSFRPPGGGDTMAHRFGLSGDRPLPDPEANLFERRQTPALFGLGLVDAIPEEVIRARADPDDRDGDGVRGRVSLLDDGRVGRFGWKGQMATLADFTEDAFANELGVVASRRPLQGELSAQAFEDVVFFLSNLAPPRPSALSVDEESRGSALFVRFGCDACHTPELPARDGRRARLYSDLLLHDVAPAGARLIPQRSIRAFRTPPLWGIGRTAPYFHDGMAETLDAAIRRHDAEALRSRDSYASAADTDRAALLAFLNAR